jgi:hypothetical protein
LWDYPQFAVIAHRRAKRFSLAEIMHTLACCPNQDMQQNGWSCVGRSLAGAGALLMRADGAGTMVGNDSGHSREGEETWAMNATMISTGSLVFIDRLLFSFSTQEGGCLLQ